MHLPFLQLDWFQRTMLGIAAAIMIFQLFVPPIVGVADNGDWGKIMLPSSFKHRANGEDHATFLASKVVIAPFGSEPAYRDHLVSGRLVALTARVIAPVISSDGLMDIRVVGALNATLLLLGLGLIMAGSSPLPVIPRRVVAALLVFIFTDAGYVAFCNSFYSQTASLLFLLIATGFFLLCLGKSRALKVFYAGFAVSAVLFAISKPQEAPQALLLGALAALMPATLGFKHPWRIAVAVGLLISIISISCGYRASWGIHDTSFYHAFFNELLAASPDPRADLVSFGLDPELSRFAGTNAYQEGSPAQLPEFQQIFYSKVSYGDLFTFYIKRPTRLWSLLSRRAEQSFALITHYGNYDSSAGFAPATQSPSFRLWSSLKRRVLPGSIWTLVAFFAVSFGAAGLWWRGASPIHRLGLTGFVILNLMAIGAFLVCSVADGRLDIVRQLFAFNAMVDLMVISLISMATTTTRVARLFPTRDRV